MKHSVKEVELKNGARGLMIDIPSATVMHYQFHFRAGNRFVRSPDIYETAHLMEHMTFGPNAVFPNEQAYSAEFSKNGAYNNAYTSDYTMMYFADCADFEWERILRLQQLAICQPRFKPEVLEAEKGNVKNEISGMLSSHSNLLWPRMQQMVGEDVLTLPERLETIDNVTLNDIAEHHARTHTTENMRFIIAGKLTGRRVKIKQILESFDLPTGKRIEIPRSKLHGSEPELIKVRDSRSWTFGISSVMNRSLTQSERNDLTSLNHILTGTMYSRIFGQARKAGLAYNIFSDFDNGSRVSSWDFAGQVVPEAASKLFELIVEVLRQVLEGELTEEELNATKSYALGRYQMGAQTVSLVSHIYSQAYFNRGEIIDYDQVPKKILEVDAKKLTKIAQEFINGDKWAFAMVGDASTRQLKQLNAILDKVF